MNQRLLVCLFVSALIGVGSAVYCVVAGLGFVLAILAYMVVSSIMLVVLAVVSMPRQRDATRPALLPAPSRRTVA